MPGTDPREAAAVVHGELDYAYLAELPARGPGSDIVGRMAAILVDLPIDAGAWGYRMVQRPSAVTRRADDLLARDLDAVEEIWDGAGFIGSGRPFKVAAAGPFTLAAELELPNGHKALRDPGAWRDLAGSAAEGIAALAGEVTRRLGAQVIVQLDEPRIGQVLDGTVPPLTRMDPNPPIPLPEITGALTMLAETVDRPLVLHDCGTPRWELLAALPGYDASVDVTAPSTADLDGLGEFLDTGRTLYTGVVEPTAGLVPAAGQLVERLAALTDRIGMPRRVLAEQIVVTPTCGLAGASSATAKAVLAACAAAGESLGGLD